MRITWTLFLAATAAVIVLIEALPSARRDTASRLRVVVTIPPQAYFVDQIGGDLVAVQTLVAPGQDVHTYAPTPTQVAWIANSRAYFTIGIPFEKSLIEKITAANKSLLIVDTTRGVPLRRLTAEEAGADVDPGAPPHEAGEPDPHSWLSPKLARIEAANICAGLKQIDPAHAAIYDANLQKLQARLDETDARIAAALAPLKGRRFFVYHPAFGYFADAYGLQQAPVEIEGKEPSPRQLTELIQSARRDGVRVIFVEPQFSPKAADAIARQIDGAVVQLDDLAYKYLDNLEDIAGKIQTALQKNASAPQESGQ